MGESLHTKCLVISFFGESDRIHKGVDEDKNHAFRG